MFPLIKPDVIPVERRWRCHPIEAGTDARGWKIGPLVICVVHWSGSASKPCHHAMTNGALPCPCQDEKLTTRKIAYLPFALQYRERVVVIVSNTVAAIIDPLPMAAPIILARSKTPCAPLAYREWPSYECGDNLTKRVATWTPCDIQPWLLHLWQDDTLSAYYAGRRSASVPTPTVVEVPQENKSALGATPPISDNPVSLIHMRRLLRRDKVE